MTKKVLHLPININYKTFSQSPLESEVYNLIDRNVLIFNQTLVDTVSLEYLTSNQFVANMQLKDGTICSERLSIKDGILHKV